VSGDGETGLRQVVTVVLAVATVWMFLCAVNVRVLVGEQVVGAGEPLVLEGWGNMGKSDSAVILCRYFTGTGFSTDMFWYAPGSAHGSDRCALVRKETLYSLRR
jgi:hypothetical protein